MGTQIDKTAIVDPSAQIGEDVVIGPGAIVEAETVIGDGCRLGASCIIRRYTRLGPRNEVHPFAVLGAAPQDLKFDPSTVSRLETGSGNVFREYVTVSRATTPGGATVIGSNSYFMAYAHVGHDARVGSECVLVNGSALAGHVEVQDRAILSAHVSVHQFCWIGEMAMTQGNSIYTMHFPPFCLGAQVNRVCGLNRVGLRRNAELTEGDRQQIREAYRLTYRSGLPLAKALEELDQRTDWGGPASRFREFLRRVHQAQGRFRRGLCPPGRDRRSAS